MFRKVPMCCQQFYEDWRDQPVRTASVIATLAAPISPAVKTPGPSATTLSLLTQKRGDFNKIAGVTVLRFLQTDHLAPVACGQRIDRWRRSMGYENSNRPKRYPMTPETNYRGWSRGWPRSTDRRARSFRDHARHGGKWRGAKTASHDIHCSVGLDKSLGDEDRIEFDTPCTEL